MITAAFTDGKALICVIPSKRSNGMYLVRAEPVGMNLFVTHDCPAQRYGRHCSHVSEAVAAYEAVQWWEPKKELVVQSDRIVLRPDWVQVPVPKLPEDRIREMMTDAS